jgi:hypothetical protein
MYLASLRHARELAAREGSLTSHHRPRAKAAPSHNRLTSILHFSIHAPVMGGLTYGTYGAGTALTVIGLCTFGTQERERRGNRMLMRMDRHAV